MRGPQKAQPFVGPLDGGLGVSFGEPGECMPDFSRSPAGTATELSASGTNRTYLKGLWPK